MKNLSIRGKLFITFGITLGLFLIFSFLTLFELLNIKYNQITARTNIANAREYLLLMNEDEKQFIINAVSFAAVDQFYNTGQTQETINWDKNYNSFLSLIDSLVGYYQKNNPQDLQKISNLKVLMQSYHQDFKLAIQKYQQTGNDTNGLIGQQEKAADTLESQLTETNSREYFFQMREREKEFSANKKRSELLAFSTALSNLRESVKGDLVINGYIDSYVNSFTKALSLEREVGLIATEGVRGEINNADDQIESTLSQLETDILNRTNNVVDFVIAIILAISICFIFVGTILTFLMSQIITNPLKELESATKELAGGNLERRITVKSDDEIGELSKSFNTMADKLEQMYKGLTQKTQELSEKLNEIERTNKLMVDRELKMIEMKEHIQKTQNPQTELKTNTTT